MSDLIEALQIFLKYGNPDYPTWCEHDALHIAGINPDEVSDADIVRLDELGFFPSDEGDFISFRYGST
jgi:hypothetical protein